MLGRSNAGGKPCDKTRRRRFMANGSVDLMQNSMLKPAFQAKISIYMTKRSANGCFFQSRLVEESFQGRQVFHPAQANIRKRTRGTQSLRMCADSLTQTLHLPMQLKEIIRIQNVTPSSVASRSATGASATASQDFQS